MRHPKLRPNPGPPPLPGQATLFRFDEAPRQVRRLTPGPELPSYGAFELKITPRPTAPPPPALALLEGEGSEHPPKLPQQARFDIADAMRRYAHDTDLAGRSKPYSQAECLCLASTVVSCAQSLAEAEEWATELLARTTYRRSDKRHALETLTAYWHLAEHDTKAGRYHE